MKKILIILSMGLLCLNLSAQTTENEQPSAAKEFKSGVHFEPAFTERIIRFGVRGGINFCKEFNRNDSKFRLGPNVGVVAEFPLGANVYMEPSIQYSLKGWKVKESYEDYTYKSLFGFHCVELTIPVGLKFPVNETVSVLADVGVKGGYCLFGHISKNYDGKKESETVKGGFGGGLGINFGTEIYKRYKITLGYDVTYYKSDMEMSWDVYEAFFSNLHLDLTVMF